MTKQRRAVTRNLQSIRRSLSAIAAALRRLDRPLQELLAARAGPPPTGTRAKLKLSPRRRAALKLQGRYIGHIRSLKPNQKAQVKAARAKKGIHAALALAARLARA